MGMTTHDMEQLVNAHRRNYQTMSNNELSQLMSQVAHSPNYLSALQRKALFITVANRLWNASDNAS